MKTYMLEDVYTASKNRISFIENTFDKVVVAFSGGKDSTLCLWLTINQIKNKPIIVYFWDKESNHLSTRDFVEETFDKISKIPNVSCYWFCLKYKMRNALSVYEPWWYCWDSDVKDKWIYQPPNKNYIITNENNILKNYNPDKHNLYSLTSNYFCENGKYKIAVIVGLRADESLNRYRAVTKNGQFNKNWITKTDNKMCFNAYPIYDWDFSDIWKYFVDNKIKYCKIYDKMFMRGIFKREMRISQSFCDVSKDSMPLYREIEPESFERFLQRVKGVNSLTHLDIDVIKKKSDIIEYDFIIQSFPEEIRKSIESSAKTKDKNTVRALLNNDIRLKRKNPVNNKQKLKDKWKEEL